MADIIRRDPFATFPFGTFPFGTGLRQTMEQFFDDPFFRPPFRLVSEEGTLPVNVSQDGKEIVVKADLPGFAKEDVEVEMHEGVLSIKASKSSEHEEKSDHYYRRERAWGSVSRRIALPGVVKDAPVDAALKDGVLTLRIPVPEHAGPKQIEIKTA